MASNRKKNLIFWECKNLYLVDAVSALVKEMKLKYELAGDLVYPQDATPDLPVAREERDYDKPHWMPVVFSITENLDAK